jgi:hypothetical protein
MKTICTDENGLPVSAMDSAATCFFKNGKYWLYHRCLIDEADEEKHNPGDKLWLILKHMCNDRDYNCPQGLGFRIDVGDIVKFGRVRYKVIMSHNHKDGLRMFDIMNRFQEDQIATKKKNP